MSINRKSRAQYCKTPRHTRYTHLFSQLDHLKAVIRLANFTIKISLLALKNVKNCPWIKIKTGLVQYNRVCLAGLLKTQT